MDRKRSLSHPASPNTRACSGDTAKRASKAIGSLTWATASSDWANVLARDSGSREIWSTMGAGPWPANAVTVLTSLAKPRSTDSEFQGESCSRSAKHRVHLAGCPCIDRSTPPGRDPPTLRMIRFTAPPDGGVGPVARTEQIVAAVHADPAGDGAVDDQDGTREIRRGSQSMHGELWRAHCLGGRQHDGEVVGRAACHDRVHGRLFDVQLDEIWWHGAHYVIASARGAGHHGRHPVRRGRDERQPV